MAKITTKDMGNRPGTAVQRKGRERVEQILDAATTLLVEEGQVQFTMNQLAKRLGIRISNLQYYFPSRDLLIQQLLNRFLDNSFSDIESITQLATTPRKRLLLTLDYILKDQENETSYKLITELWSLSNRDEKIGQAMDDFYERYCDHVCDMISGFNPDMPPRKKGRLSVLIVSMLEGLSLMRGYGKRRHAFLQGIEKELQDTILELVED